MKTLSEVTHSAVKSGNVCSLELSLFMLRSPDKWNGVDGAAAQRMYSAWDMLEVHESPTFRDRSDRSQYGPPHHPEQIYLPPR